MLLRTVHIWEHELRYIDGHDVVLVSNSRGNYPKQGRWPGFERNDAGASSEVDAVMLLPESEIFRRQDWSPLPLRESEAYVTFECDVAPTPSNFPPCDSRRTARGQ